MLKDAPARESGWDDGSADRGGGSSSGPRRDIISLRAPATERPAEPAEKTERPAEPAEKEAKPGQQPAAKEEKPSEKPRKGFLRRHPILTPLGLVALLLAAVAGYIYWDYTSHFESTDDAFIAARQFAIAPQVAGYVTAVPVTDNQHVARGAVIAQIDQRDYLAALAQANAQVAGAQAGIQNVNAQIATQQAQIAASQAQVAQAQANLELTRRPGNATSRSSTRAGRRSSRERSTSRASRPSRPRSTALKRRSKSLSARSIR